MGQVRYESPLQMLSAYQRMQPDDATSLSAPDFVALLKACTKLKDLERGTEIHAEVARKGLLEKNVFVGTTLVDMYAKGGLLAKAQQVFDRLPKRNIVSWTTLIGGYANNERSEETLLYFERMQEEGIPTNLVTFVSCLKACCTIRDIEKGQRIHSELERRGLLSVNVVLASALLDMYVKCGQLIEAHYVLSKLPVQNVITWTSLIAGYVEHGKCEEALACFEQMQNEGVPPIAATYAPALKACAILGDTHRGREIHKRLEGSGFLEGNFRLGNILVSMYGKCGLPAKARLVFDTLRVRDVVCWNSLIGAYNRNGFDEEVLDCYEQMKLEGVSPDHVTFIQTLKACGNIAGKLKGREIHKDVEKQQLLEDSVIGNALVEMYAKCGLFPIARQVFDHLPVHTMISWNALIAGYVELGHDREALDCFDLMQIEGLSPMPITFMYALKACNIAKHIEKSEQLHAEIERRGLLESNIIIANTLIDLYAKLGLLSSSREVFDRLRSRDVVTWSVLIGSYIKCGLGEEALMQFEQMQSDGVSPNAVTYNFVLKACCISQAFMKGQEIHAEMERQGLLKNTEIFGATLINLYSKCGSLAQAEEMFKRLTAQNTDSWNALIAGYVEHGDYEKAMWSVEQMQQEGFAVHPETFMHILKVCGTIGSMDVGDKLCAAIEQSGLLDRDPILGVALVKMYAKCGSLQRAQQVFDKLTDRGVALWTALIAGYSEHGHTEEALRLYEQMCIDGVPHDPFTMVTGLKACGNASAAHLGKQIHVEIKEQEFLGADLVVGNALVDMYARCGLLATAHQVLNELPARSVISWTSLIAGYANHGDAERALQCLEQMQSEGFSPNAATYACSLKACGRIGCMETGGKLHVEIERQGLWDRDLTVGNAVVDMYARCGKLNKAQQVFDKLRVRTTALWTAVMAGYARVGEAEKVFCFLRRMQEEGLHPNEITFVVILTACIRMGLFHKGHTFLEAMSKDYGILLVPEHYTCGISLLGQAGHLDRALSISKKLPMGIDLVAYHGVLFACNSCGNARFGRCVFEQFLHAEI